MLQVYHMSDFNEKPKTIYRTIRLRVSEYEFKRFEQAQNIGLTQREVIEQLLQTCCCTEITIFDKEKKQSITLPKNFLIRNKNAKIT